jgi:outer membrane receptor protein involved in Fe transport
MKEQVNGGGFKGRIYEIGTFLILLVMTFSAMSSQVWANDIGKGRITGKLVDSETGEALIGANVVLYGTTIGAASDMDGNFTITKIPAGNYTVVISMIGYSTKKLLDVKVSPGEITKIDLAMPPEALAAEDVVVTAKLLRDNEASLLKERQKAAAVSDAISAEAISRAGGSTAADAMEQVTGASIVDSKYIYVRGLGDRYMSTRLNDVTLPSSDPDRNAVSVDIFPAKFIENIVTTKTFTPDQPGSFTGGSVNIKTKSFPESFSMSFANSVAYNTQTTLSDFITYSGGDTDWLGIDDGTRSIPDPLADRSVQIPNIGTAFRDRQAALELDRLSKSFNSVMAPAYRQAPVNQSYAFSIGNQGALFGKPLGYFASLSYNRNLSSYNDGLTAQYQLTGNVAQVNELTNLFRFTDTQGSDEVLWGGLANLTFKPHPNHSLQANYTYNRSGESMARYQTGPMPRDLAPGTLYETRVLQFTERELQSVQLNGEHFARTLFNLRLDWTGSYSKSTQEEPDLRFFSNDYTPVNRQGRVDTLYAISQSNYSRPVRYYRDLDEDIWDSYLNLSLPFTQWNGLKSAVKFGGAFGHKERRFRERRFEYFQSSARYTGDPESFFSPQNVGLVDSSGSFYRFGNYIVDATQRTSNYDGDQDIYAAFGMVDVPLFRRLRLIGGLRFESTRMNVASFDPNKPHGRLATDDVLPSVNLIYHLGETMNLRAAFGRTLARPTFRELAPFASFDFVGDFIFIGNPNLQRTLINNYDLRWEWFARPGEIFAVSGFYKGFENPIERAIVSNNNQGQFQNVDHARVYGLEFEFRKRLDQVLSALSGLQMGGNFALIHSEVDIPPKELLPIRELDPNASAKRPLQGQSPFVLNVDVGYDNNSTGTTISVFYNLFGKRLSEVSLGGTPNVYEQPRGALDVTFSQKVWRGLSFKASARNLLDASVKKSHIFKGQEFVVSEHKLGRTLSFGTSYSID